MCIASVTPLAALFPVAALLANAEQPVYSLDLFLPSTAPTGTVLVP